MDKRIIRINKNISDEEYMLSDVEEVIIGSKVRIIGNRAFAFCKQLKKAGFIKDENYIEFTNSAFLFAYKDKLFLIDHDLCVLEINDYVAIGSGSSEAIGSLLSTEGEDPKTRIIKAIKASAANDIYVDYQIILTDTETTKFDIITEDLESEIIKPRKKKESSDDAEKS